MSKALTAAEQIDSRPVTKNQKSLIAMTVFGNISEFFDLFLIGFVVSMLAKAPGWHLTGMHSGIILAGAGLGTVLGAIFWGRMADRFGRKHAFVWCIIVLVIFTGASVLTPTNGWLILAILRTFVGFGVGGLNITSVPYVQEFVPAKQRGLLAGLTSVFIPAGLFLGSLASKLEPSIGWRGVVAIGMLPVLLLAWAHVVPESPRFLIAQGRVEEARKAYAWALEIKPEEVGALPEVKKEHSASYSVIFKHYRKELLIVTVGSFCFITGCFTVQSWGQSLLGGAFKFSLSTITTLFMLVSLADLIGRLASAWISDRIGRRWTMFIFGVIGGIGCLVAAFSSSLADQEGHTAESLHSAGVIFFIGILLVMMFGDGAFGILNAFGGEQFPNEARSTGLGLGYGVGAIAKVFGPTFVGWIIGSGKPTPDVVFWPFIVFGGLLFLGAVVYMFAKETKATQLEKI